MPIQVRVQTEQAPTSWGTYGATGVVTFQKTKNIDRTRSWTNSTYRTAGSRAKYLLAHGFLPTQPYTDDTQCLVNSKLVTATGQLTSDPRSTFLWRFIPGVPRITCSTDDADVSTLRARALDSLQSKLSGVGVSVPMTILDAGKTADMIGQAAMRIYTAYRHVRHGNFRAAAVALNLPRTPKRVSRSRSIADNWMEYRYGWRLVVYDVDSYMKQIWNMLRDKPIVYRETVKMSSSSMGVYSNPGQVLYNQSTHVATYTRNRSDRRDVSVTTGYVYQLQNESIALGQQLGLINPGSVIWDAIPGSFMLDWALNVSSVLEGLSAFVGKTYLDGWTASAVQTTRIEWWTSAVRGGGVYKLNAGMEFYSPEVIERRFKRVRLSNFTPASLRLDFSANFKNAVDGLALVGQVFSNRRSHP